MSQGTHTRAHTHVRNKEDMIHQKRNERFCIRLRTQPAVALIRQTTQLFALVIFILHLHTYIITNTHPSRLSWAAAVALEARVARQAAPRATPPCTCSMRACQAWQAGSLAGRTENSDAEMHRAHMTAPIRQ